MKKIEQALYIVSNVPFMIQIKGSHWTASQSERKEIALSAGLECPYSQESFKTLEKINISGKGMYPPTKQNLVWNMGRYYYGNNELTI